MTYYTYILRCSDNSLYTGYTTDIDKRIEVHNSGKGAKYTRNRGPVRLVYYEEYDNKQAAMSREWHIKRLSHRQKEELILISKEKCGSIHKVEAKGSE
ncbi:MAG: GIY-YIG nuclease family protein [Lachnospiraceae bacterium]|nr:GIY-YIG nuclease family protein [Lachnospiraceae bacterium]